MREPDGAKLANMSDAEAFAEIKRYIRYHAVDLINGIIEEAPVTGVRLLIQIGFGLLDKKVDASDVDDGDALDEARVSLIEELAEAAKRSKP